MLAHFAISRAVVPGLGVGYGRKFHQDGALNRGTFKNLIRALGVKKSDRMPLQRGRNFAAISRKFGGISRAVAEKDDVSRHQAI